MDEILLDLTGKAIITEISLAQKNLEIIQYKLSDYCEKEGISISEYRELVCFFDLTKQALVSFGAYNYSENEINEYYERHIKGEKAGKNIGTLERALIYTWINGGYEKINKLKFEDILTVVYKIIKIKYPSSLKYLALYLETKDLILEHVITGTFFKKINNQRLTYYAITGGLKL